MKTLIRLTAVSAMLTAGLVLAENAPINSNANEAKEVIKTFSMQLKGELKHALEEGGPLKAIAVCKERAPAIATEVGEKTGWQIGRTTLKPRNVELNTPDAWEQGVLNEFAKRKAAGEDVQTIAFGEVVETDAGKTFRFMKAIPTMELCLACHGTQIAPEVAKAIDENYPKDQARGYSEGDLRGAFSVSKPL
ncbi:glutamate synthase [Chromatium weissei]|nr:glutamate synthase [Chromatium weissei]